jgi:diguanylate cyclase (GGDEF)-like protein
MTDQYNKRLLVVAHHAGIFVELEQARLAEREARVLSDEIFDNPRTLSQGAQTQADTVLRDDLTGSFSRRGLAHSSETLFTPERQLAVVMADIDNFKSINNKYGHEAGDKILQAMARIFNRSLRDSDLVARPGGEEFLLIITDVGNEAAWGTCERLRVAVEKHGWDRIAPNLHVTASLGLSVRLNDEELDVLIPKAEAAMQKAKAEGRNCVVAGE